MVLEKPREKTISKLETLKVESDHLLLPLKEELYTEEIGISKDAYNILKYHGSYQQSNREIRGKVKDYQFMLRLKQPAGELPPELYRLIDDLSANYGQGDLRANTPVFPDSRHYERKPQDCDFVHYECGLFDCGGMRRCEPKRHDHTRPLCNTRVSICTGMV